MKKKTRATLPTMKLGVADSFRSVLLKAEILKNRAFSEIRRPLRKRAIMQTRREEQAAAERDTKSVIFVDSGSFRRDRRGNVLHDNWGDDLNLFFLEAIFGKKFVCGFDARGKIAFPHEPHFQFIGSIIGPAGDVSRTVWGSGIQHPEKLPRELGRRQKFLAVRGPLTREKLRERGCECPEIYGDPALLLPKFLDFVPPPKRERRGIGLILQWRAERNFEALRFAQKIAQIGGRVIPTRGYRDWREFVRDVCACEFVVSASLHGLILAEAYGIPNVWCGFSAEELGESLCFKYRDFYASVGKAAMTPLRISEKTTLRELKSAAANWLPGKIDTAPLLAACPFPIVKGKI